MGYGVQLLGCGRLEFVELNTWQKKNMFFQSLDLVRRDGLREVELVLLFFFGAWWPVHLCSCSFSRQQNMMADIHTGLMCH